MDALHAHAHAHANHRSRQSLGQLALSATLHCLAGCSIGEVLGMVLGSIFALSNGSTIALSIVLAFVFGYGLTMRPLLRAGIPMAKALPLALASDTLSIGTMEIVDNAIMLLIPGAMDAHVTSAHFWGSMGLALALAGVAAYPINRWLIGRGAGHARVHQHHAAGS